MKGLEIAEGYWHDVVAPMVRRSFPELENQIAAGLVGEGSECFGFDDEISRDHDFGPGVCLWLPDALMASHGEALQRAYDALPKSYAGVASRKQQREAGQRVGVFGIEAFYGRYYGSLPWPKDAMDWLRIPQKSLATATNGKVFADPLGQFSEIRRNLQAYYPIDVQRKKLAAAVIKAGQAGQYNYPRALKREDGGQAFMALCAFVEAYLQSLFLLNKRYLPFYKWRFRSALDLPLGARQVRRLLDVLQDRNDGPQGAAKGFVIEQLCDDLAEMLRTQGFSQEKGNFLPHHGTSIMQKIGDPRLVQLPPIFDIE